MISCCIGNKQTNKKANTQMHSHSGKMVGQRWGVCKDRNKQTSGCAPELDPELNTELTETFESDGTAKEFSFLLIYAGSPYVRLDSIMLPAYCRQLCFPQPLPSCAVNAYSPSGCLLRNSVAKWDTLPMMFSVVAGRYGSLLRGNEQVESGS